MGGRGASSGKTSARKLVTVAEKAKVGDNVAIKDSFDGLYSYWEQMLQDKVAQYGRFFDPAERPVAGGAGYDTAATDNGRALDAALKRDNGDITNQAMRVTKATDKALQVEVVVSKRSIKGGRYDYELWNVWMPRKAFVDKAAVSRTADALSKFASAKAKYSGVVSAAKSLGVKGIRSRLSADTIARKALAQGQKSFVEQNFTLTGRGKYKLK